LAKRLHSIPKTGRAKAAVAALEWSEANRLDPFGFYDEKIDISSIIFRRDIL
jgi:hypothetical protein